MDIQDKETLKKLAPQVQGEYKQNNVVGTVQPGSEYNKFALALDTRPIDDTDPVRQTVRFCDEMHLKGGTAEDRKVSVLTESNGNVTLISEKHGDQLLLPCLKDADKSEVLQVVEAFNVGQHD